MEKVLFLDSVNKVELALEVTPEECALIEKLCDMEIIPSDCFTVIYMDDVEFERP